MKSNGSLTRRSLGLAGLALASSPALGQSAAPASAMLSFGMVPYLPTMQLVQAYEPMVRKLEEILQRRMQLESGRDFDDFLVRARRTGFDVVGASPHIARILQREHGYGPLVRATAALEPVIMVRADRSIDSTAALKGQSVLVADRSALHVLMGLRALRDAGIAAGRDVRLLPAGNQRNAIQRLANGEAAAACASLSTLGTLPTDLVRRVTVLLRAPKAITPMAFLHNPRLASNSEALRRGLLDFGTSDIGKKMAAALQHESYVPLLPQELQAQDPVVTEFYRVSASASE